MQEKAIIMLKDDVPLWVLYSTSIIFLMIIFIEIIIFSYEINNMLLNQEWFKIIFDLITMGFTLFILFVSIKDIKLRSSE